MSGVTMSCATGLLRVSQAFTCDNTLLIFNLRPTLRNSSNRQQQRPTTTFSSWVLFVPLLRVAIQLNSNKSFHWANIHFTFKMIGFCARAFCQHYHQTFHLICYFRTCYWQKARPVLVSKSRQKGKRQQDMKEIKSKIWLPTCPKWHQGPKHQKPIPKTKLNSPDMTTLFSYKPNPTEIKKDWNF